MNSFAIIILGGGKGLRMGKALPKQFIEIKGKPILFYTIEAFLNFNDQIDVFLALPQDHIDYWNSITENWEYIDRVKVVEGGKERFYSVKNCLDVMSQYESVAIHDGVRPMLSMDFLERIFSFKKENIAWVPVIPLIDSIRKINEDESSQAVSRSEYCAVQTPQVFDFEKIKKAYNQSFSENFTDDASVFESFGEKVSTFAGDSKNIKITQPEDLIFANLYLGEES